MLSAHLAEPACVDRGELRLTDRFVGDGGASGLLSALKGAGREGEVTALDLTGCNLHEAAPVAALAEGLPQLKRLRCAHGTDTRCETDELLLCEVLLWCERGPRSE